MVFIIEVCFFAIVDDGVVFVVDEFLCLVLVNVHVLGYWGVHEMLCDFAWSELGYFFVEVIVLSLFDDVEDLRFCFFVFVQRCEVDPVWIVVRQLPLTYVRGLSLPSSSYDTSTCDS